MLNAEPQPTNRKMRVGVANQRRNGPHMWRIEVMVRIRIRIWIVDAKKGRIGPHMWRIRSSMGEAKVEQEKDHGCLITQHIQHYLVSQQLQAKNLMFRLTMKY